MMGSWSLLPKHAEMRFFGKMDVFCFFFFFFTSVDFSSPSTNKYITSTFLTIDTVFVKPG